MRSVGVFFLAISLHVVNCDEAFLVRLKSCTGSLIAPDWVLTAAHCFHPLDGGEKNANGDLQSALDEDVEVNGAERKVIKVILNGAFKSEALSWKGNDLALLQLDQTNNESSLVVCLPGKASEGDLSMGNGGAFLMAGFGRRFLPHCLTDSKGPERFETCARPVECSKSPRTRHCGLKFLYNGTYHSKCLQGPTPSAADANCAALRAQIGADDLKSVHVFKNDQYSKTCFATKAENGRKGWCTTRTPSVDRNQEPEASSGWGFCSESSWEKHCENGIIPAKSADPTPIEINVLNDKFCVEKLANNLEVEQPDVKRSEFQNLLTDLNVFCTGRNATHVYDEDVFVVNGKVVDESESLKVAVARALGRFDVNGGTACFGDSGGPLYKALTWKGRKTALQVGVYSFTLWGTCQGIAEPSYYVRTSRYLDWIAKYVKRNDLCIIKN